MCGGTVGFRRHYQSIKLYHIKSYVLSGGSLPTTLSDVLSERFRASILRSRQAERPITVAVSLRRFAAYRRFVVPDYRPVRSTSSDVCWETPSVRRMLKSWVPFRRCPPQAIHNAVGEQAAAGAQVASLRLEAGLPAAPVDGSKEVQRLTLNGGVQLKTVDLELLGHGLDRAVAGDIGQVCPQPLVGVQVEAGGCVAACARSSVWPASNLTAACGCLVSTRKAVRPGTSQPATTLRAYMFEYIRAASIEDAPAGAPLFRTARENRADHCGRDERQGCSATSKEAL